ncbi:MAG TPA: hypothetical protein VMZ51_03295 [Acidimicrobiales bacterium]|nr:hypothetical protein [Acidimicrobiales bacterium]
MSLRQLPAEEISGAVRWAATIVSVGVVLVSSSAMKACAKVMRKVGGVGNLGLELLGSWERADPVLDAWRARPDGKAAARKALRVDFAFIAGYVSLGVVVAATVASRAGDRTPPWAGWADAARAAGWAIVAAGALDVFEDISLFGTLAERRDHNWPGIAAAFARAKWVLAIVAVMVVLTVVAALASGSGSGDPAGNLGQQGLARLGDRR